RQIRTQRDEKNVSRIRTLPRRRISRRASIPHRTIRIAPAAIAMTAKGRTMVAAATAAAEGAGVAGADAIAADASKVVRAGEIWRHRSMLRHKAASIADTTIAIAAVNSAAATISADRKLRVVRVPRLRTFRKKRSYFRANRSLSIPTNPWPSRLPLQR